MKNLKISDVFVNEGEKRREWLSHTLTITGLELINGVLYFSAEERPNNKFDVQLLKDFYTKV